MKTRTLLAFILLSCGTVNLFPQLQDYKFRHEITEITDSWHQVYLPDELFSSVQPDFDDIRIIGITAENDTIEAPFIIKKQSDKLLFLDMPFRLINQVKSGTRYYSSFATRKNEPINQINLDLSDENYNLSVRLEGSNNRYKWYEIIDDYRIVGISNDFVKYSFNKIMFPDAQYKFYRVSWESSNKNKLLSATLEQCDLIKGKSVFFNSHYKVQEDPNAKLTIVDITLEKTMPVSKITIETANNFDFYRPITVQKVIDSVKIKEEWQIYYSDIYSNVLSSLEKPVYRIPENITNKLRILIYNNDNEPLTIKNIDLEGDVYSLNARFTKEAKYYLYYGNPHANKPEYDIKYFGENIPNNLKTVSLGKVETLIKPATSLGLKKVKKLWLWIVMGLIVIILGGFTIHMIKNSNDE